MNKKKINFELTKQSVLLKMLMIVAKMDYDNLIAAYQYGSRTYKNYSEKSDFDFTIVVKKKGREQFKNRVFNDSFFTKEEHQERLNNHEISALESYFLPKEFVLYQRKNYRPLFKLDLVKLRHSLSAKASNSFVKAKKKLTVAKDYDKDIGRKSLWHSFRIIAFGIQIATQGKIFDYSACNELFKEIMQVYSWDELFKKYKKEHNKIMSEFRKFAPKE